MILLEYKMILVDKTFTKMQKRTTLKELSKVLNLSVSTISKSLADSHEISIETKERVKKIASIYNYTPNQYAQNLKRGTPKTIGVIIPNILDPFFAEILIALEEKLAENGYNTLISITNESIEKETNSINMFSSGLVSGIVMCIGVESHIKKAYQHIERVINQRLPIVLFDRVTEDLNCDKVINNDYEASLNATEHLIKIKRCKKIALVSSIGNLKLGRARINGYKNALLKHELQIDNDVILDSSNPNEFKHKVKELIKNKTIDGILGVNEVAIISTISEAKKMGIDISKSLKVATFYGKPELSGYPDITIIDQNALKIGKETAELILNRIKKSALKNYITSTIKVSMA